MRAPRLLLSLALVFAAAVAGGAEAAHARVEEASIARHDLLDRLVERERAPLLPRALLSSYVPIPRAPSAPRATSSMDCEHATHDIALDPETGHTDATLELRVKAARGPLASISFSFDAGLKPGRITASGGRDIAVAEDTFDGSRVVRVDFTPALEVGETTVVSMPYSGTLACASSHTSGAVCSRSPEFTYLAQHSVFPYVFDPNALEDIRFDGLTRDIVLRVSAKNDVVATGQKVSDVVEGDTRISRWSIDKPLSRIVGIYAFVGRLGMRPVTGRAAPTTFVFPRPAGAFDDALVSWSAPALDFVEQTGGGRLPFERGLTLVRLPQVLGDPGTATFGMTLLSDSYANTGELMYEETWAHENAHLFWGIVVPETDSHESRLMSEGMATLTQIEYSHGRHFAAEDRDRYLARRLLPLALDLRVAGKDLPPPALSSLTSVREELRTRRYTMWAYYQTALALDHLRVSVGEDLFARALGTYKSRCSFAGCRPDDLRTIVSETVGKDVSAFFDRWVTGRERPRLRIGFRPTREGAEVELGKDDDRPMTLELWLELADGARVKRRVDLDGRVTRAHVDVESAEPVVGVSASPRHELLVDVRSAVEGDLDFDGESDGFDILRCARLVGATYDAKPAAGLWRPHETFDARCDLDGDLIIDDRDLERLAAAFGTLRSR